MYVLKFNETLNEAKKVTKLGFINIVICYILYSLVVGLMSFLLLGSDDNMSFILLANIIGAFICVVYIVIVGKRTFVSLGMDINKIGSYITGCIFSALALFIIWLFNILSGAVKTSFNSELNVYVLLFLMVGFIFQGFMEEFLLRGLLFVQLALKTGVVIGLILNSLIFALMHLGNAGASLISTVNTFLIGLAFSMMYYYHDNIWVMSGFHSGWNFILGPVLGIPVSGFMLPSTILKTSLSSELTLLNGGSYGFEAGLPVTFIAVCIIAAYTVLIYKQNKSFKNNQL